MSWEDIHDFANNRPGRRALLNRENNHKDRHQTDLRHGPPACIDLYEHANRPWKVKPPYVSAKQMEVVLPFTFIEDGDDKIEPTYTLETTLLDVIHIYHFRSGGWRIVIENLGGTKPVMWNIDPKRIRALRSEIAALARGYITPAEFAAHLSSIEQVQGEI